MFLQIFNKSKPQNLQFPINVVLESKWSSKLLQINFIENVIQAYTEKKDKSINFLKLGGRRQENIEEL